MVSHTASNTANASYCNVYVQTYRHGHIDTLQVEICLTLMASYRLPIASQQKNKTSDVAY